VIDVLAAEGHFVDHLAPVWLALPEEQRGAFHYIGRGHDRDLPGWRRDLPKPSESKHTLVASAGDLIRARHLRRPTAIMEHGCGQSFGGDPKSATHSSYAGGRNRDAQLFLHPGPHPAGRDRRAYPAARVEVVGCAKLDTLPRKKRGRTPVVAIGFHWDCRVCRETRSAHMEFGRMLNQLTDRMEVIGTGHPRIIDKLASSYRLHGIEVVKPWEEVCRRADVYINDASSTLFEFASTGRPVVVMNPPWYRRNINHGLRFWDAATVGVQVTPQGSLVEAVHEALEECPPQIAAREAALDLVYDRRPGAAQRAADVLVDWCATTS